MNRTEIEKILAQTDFVHSLARSLVLDESSADDISQQAFLAAIESRPSAGSPLRAWFSGVVRNLTRLSHRKERNRLKREQIAARSDGDPSAASVAELREVRRIIVEAVLGLGEPYRSAIELRYFAELKTSQVAEKLDIPVETARTRLKRGLARLRECLDAEFGGDRTAWCLALAPLAGIKLTAASLATTSAATVSPVSEGIPALIRGTIAMSTKVKMGIPAVILLASAVVLFCVLDDDTGEGDAGFGGSGGNRKTVDGTRESPVKWSAEDGRDSSRDADLPREKIKTANVVVNGRVLSVDGMTVENVLIQKARVEGYSGARLDYSAAWKDTSIQPDAEGRFRFELPARELPLTYLRFEHPHYDEVQATLFKSVPWQGDSFLLEDVILRPARIVRGLVVDGSGDPVARCAVTFWNGSRERADEGCRDNTVYTDEEGLFTIKETTGLAGWPNRIRAFKEGTGVGMSREVVPTRSGSAPHVKIIIKRALPISGRLLMADGSPAARRDLVAEGRLNANVFRQEMETDDQGRFLLDPVQEAVYRIKIRNVKIPGPEPEEDERYLVLAEAVTPGMSDLEFYLPPDSRVLINIADEEGEPIQTDPHVDFSVTTTCGDYYLSGPAQWSGKVEMLTPGTYECRGLPGGKYSIYVGAEGFETFRAEDIEIPPPPGTKEVSVVLERCGVISGKIYFCDGNPAPGVSVLKERTRKLAVYRENGWSRHFTAEGIRMRWSSGGSRKLVITDEEGSFRFENVKRGFHHFFVRVDGHEVYSETPVKISGKNPQAELEIKLPPLTGSIVGEVRDARGSPLSRACVVMWDGDKLFNVTRSDEAGRFGFNGLPGGRYIVDARVIREARGFSPGTRNGIGTSGRGESGCLDSDFNAVVRNGSPCHLDLVVEDPWESEVEVHIVTSDSRPLPSVMKCTVTKFSEDGKRERTKGSAAASLFRYSINHKKVDLGPGSFKYFDLRGGRHKITVFWMGVASMTRLDGPVAGVGGGSAGQPASRISSLWQYEETFTVVPSSKTELTVHLPLADLRGMVVDRYTGEMIPGAEVIIQPVEPEGNPVRFRTGEKGLFDVRDLPAGTIDLTVLHDDYIPFSKEEIYVAVGECREGLRLEMSRGALTLRGILKIAAGRERRRPDFWHAPEWRVVPRITSLGANYDLGVDADVEGRFMFKGLPPGEVTLVVFHCRKKVHEEVISLPVPEGEDIIIEIH